MRFLIFICLAFQFRTAAAVAATSVPKKETEVTNVEALRMALFEERKGKREKGQSLIELKEIERQTIPSVEITLYGKLLKFPAALELFSGKSDDVNVSGDVLTQDSCRPSDCESKSKLWVDMKNRKSAIILKPYKSCIAGSQTISGERISSSFKKALRDFCSQASEAEFYDVAGKRTVISFAR